MLGIFFSLKSNKISCMKKVQLDLRFLPIEHSLHCRQYYCVVRKKPANIPSEKNKQTNKTQQRLGSSVLLGERF